ncbi:MAG: hypothetical protein JRN21_00010 [Nitrososphaerota archaeon]|nr:hypothetical protein [Nitrososphaerota archaeon]
MTHYFLAVLLNKDNGTNFKEKAEELLAPYDEQLKGVEHEETCYCVGREARRNAYNAARDRFGSHKASIESLDYAMKTFESDPKRSSPDSKCEFCLGTGKCKTVYNPKGEWDWWRVGGRWDGAIQGKPQDYDGHGNVFGEGHLEHNISTPKFMLDHDIIPAAIVTPDGVWHEEDFENFEGWARWSVRAKSILSNNLETLAVGIDIHK